MMGQQQYVATQHGQQMVRIVHNPNVPQRMPTANYHHDNTNNPSSFILQGTDFNNKLIFSIFSFLLKR